MRWSVYWRRMSRRLEPEGHRSLMRVELVVGGEGPDDGAGRAAAAHDLAVGPTAEGHDDLVGEAGGLGPVGEHVAELVDVHVADAGDVGAGLHHLGDAGTGEGPEAGEPEIREVGEAVRDRVVRPSPWPSG